MILRKCLLVLLFCTATTYAQVICPSPTPSNSITVAQIEVSAAETGNGPCNMMDNDPVTRWSAQGEHSAIFDLGTTKSFDQLQIAYYLGDQRNYSFNIEVSTNATSWSPVGAIFQTSGTSTELENHGLGAQTARYIRYLGHGSNVNNWNNISEFKIVDTGSGNSSSSGDCAFSDTFSNATGGGTHTFLYDAVETLKVDFNMIDNSFSLSVNNTGITNTIIGLETGELNAGEVLLVFPNQGNTVISQPWLTNTEGLPRVQITVDISGNVTIMGTQYVGSTTMNTMAFTDGSSLNQVNFITSTNTITIVNPNDGGDDGISGTVSGTTACGTTGSGNGLWATNTYGIDFDRVATSSNNNVGIGTPAQSGYRLAVNGKIHTREVRVDEDGWADYVFFNDYNLPTLQEVAQHIQEKGHLINIPSAAEVKANGIELGKMNKLLLEKIEELTLYILKQEKNQKALEARMKVLEE